MKKLRKRIFAAVLAVLMLTTAMPGTALYASAETETVSDNAIGQAGTEDTGKTMDGDTEEPGTDDAEETVDGDTGEPVQEPPTGPLEEDTVKCICETLCTQDSINGDCPVCGADDASLLDCKGKVSEENTENQEDTGICKHHQEHDADCGYIPKSEDGEGSPCTYECRICPVEDLIAALPEQVTADNAAIVRGQLNHILDLFGELNEDEQGQIDLSRCYELQEALDNANASMMVAEEIDIFQNWNNILTEDGDCPGHTFTGTTANGAMIYVESGAHDVTFSDLNITTSAEVGIAPGATMNLTIDGTNTIQAGNSLAGIYVPAGATLVINGNGSLNVSGAGNAGIGGAINVPDENKSEGDPNCGTVVINSGTVTATGGSGGAGIGGGMDAFFNPGNGGTVTINGGTVIATGGSDGYYGGAGIGGGSNGDSGSGGTLTINGGHVTLAPGTHDPQYPAYGFGRGSSENTSGVTCELTLADASYLDSGTTLDPNGKYTINGDPTADMIVVPEELIYNGKAQELDGKIYIDDSKTDSAEYFGQTFSVKASADGWVLQDLGEVVGAGEYTATFKKGDKEISKTFTVAKSGTDLKTEGKVKTYNGSEETTSFSADDTITVKAAPAATGTAPQKTAARLRADPTAGQMALFVGDVQVSESVEAEADGTYIMTVSAAEVLLKGNAEPNGNAITLTAKFVGNDNMADAAGTVDVRISAVAMAEKGGTVIGYYGESNLADAFARNSGNAGATITLLDNITTSTLIVVNTDNLTLDLNGKTYTCTDNAFLVFLGSLTIKGSGEVTSTSTYCLAVNGGTLNIENGSFYAERSAVNVSSGTIQLTGGSFTGETSAIAYASGEVKAALANYGGADAPHYAFYQGSSPYAPSGSSLPSGTFAVKECRHTGVEVTNLGDGKHGLTCPYCGYSYSHDSTTLPTLVATADQTANTVTLSEGCDIADCDYRSAVGTVSFAFPKAVYGQTDQAVTLTGIPADYSIICQAEGGNQIQNQNGDTEMSLTLKDLFGSTEITAGDHKLSVWFGSCTTGTFSNKCELTFTIAKADQTPLSITGAPGSVTYGDTFQLAVSGGSGTGPVSWAASGATVDDAGNVTITRVGFVVITAMKEGDGNYTGIEGQITLNVNTASLTVTANDQTIAYGGNIEEGKEQVTVTGLCGSDTLTDINLTPSTENVPGGTGTIIPSAAQIQNGSSGDATANYDITYKTGTLTIGKIQNAPGMPSAVMDNVSNSCQKVSDVPLPDGWVWQDSDKDTALEVGVPVSATAVYNGADREYYENVTVTVTVTRSTCDHTEGEILYTGAGESAPTCTKAGLGHTACTKCGAVVREYITVLALGHDYDAGEVTKEPTLEDEGERKYTCTRCGHTYTETIPRKEPQGLWIDHMKPSMNYTGAAVRQEEIEVYYGSTLLREKVDYTISYKNNSKAGTAQIIVTGKGNYTGKATENFEIRPIDVGAWPGMTAIVTTAVETGKNLKPAVTVTWNGKKLKEKTDYTLSYSTSIKTAGEYEVTVSGKGNYTGSMVKTFSVKPRGTKLLKNATVSGIKKSYPYPGSGLAADLQSVVVKMGKTTLVKGTDYTVRMENTDVVGTGTVIIEAAQTDVYAGEKRIAVSITGTDLKKGSIKGVEKSYPYTGRPITPQITVYSGKNGKGEVISADKYTVSYTNNTEKGKATVTATGISGKGYSGSVKVSYQIGRLNLADEKAAGNLKVIMPADISHAKGGAKPQPVITYTYEGVTRTLREGADYTLKYSNHTTATGSKPPTVKITGKGNYSGNITESFAISKQDIGRLSITVTDRAYGKTRKGSYYYSAPKVYDLDGKQLKSGRDYTVQYTYADGGNPIGKNDKIEPGTKLCAVVAAHEKSSYTGTLRAVYVVREAKEVKDIGKVKNDKIENQPYTGSAITPEVSLYTQTGKIKTYLTEESYEVIGCYNNTKRGTATILVRGKGVYSGVKRITFKIVQKKIR